jgi:hypothetical protein
VVLAEERRRRRKKKPRARSRMTPAMQPMTMPAMAPPERPALDDEAAEEEEEEEEERVEGLEATKTVVVGAGVLDVVTEEKEVWKMVCQLLPSHPQSRDALDLYYRASLLYLGD